MAKVLAEACRPEVAHESACGVGKSSILREYSLPQTGGRLFRRTSAEGAADDLFQVPGHVYESPPVAPQGVTVTLDISRGGIAIEELLRGRIVDHAVRLDKVGEQTHRHFAVGAFETRYADLSNLSFGIGTAPRVVSQMRQAVQLAAPRTSFRRPNLQVGFLRDVLLDCLAWTLQHHLHEAGE